MTSTGRLDVNYSWVDIKIIKAHSPTVWYADKIGKILNVRKRQYIDHYDGSDQGYSYEIPSKGPLDPSFSFSNYDVIEITKEMRQHAKATGQAL